MREGAPRDPSRRSALKTILGGAMVAGGVKYLIEHDKSEGELTKERAPSPEVLRTVENCLPEDFETRGLAGRNMHSLYAEYLGLPEESDVALPETVSISYPQVLETLWQKKQAFMQSHPGNEDTDVHQTADERVGSYARRWQGVAGQSKVGKAEALGRTTLIEEMEALDGRLAAIKERLLTDEFVRGLRKQYGHNLSDEEMEVALTLAQKIDAKMILAYSMTELLPAQNGVTNALFYDFLLRTAGKEYIASLPALYDNRLSFGAMQMTTTGYSEQGRPHGASVINQILPEEVRLQAKDVTDIYELDDQLVSGYLFAINILVSAVKTVPKPHYSAFRDMKEGTLLDFIATSHNNPEAARKALGSWLRNQHSPHEKHLTYINCIIDDSLKQYGEKSAENYGVLYDLTKA